MLKQYFVLFLIRNKSYDFLNEKKSFVRIYLAHPVLVNDRNRNFCRYRNFGNFGIGQKATDTDTESGCIPIPKPIPKDDFFSEKMGLC